MRLRLQKLIEQEGLTSAKFAEIVSVQPSTISHLLSGRNKPNFELIAKLLLNFPDLNARWLINGEEPMYVSQPTTELYNSDDTNKLPATDTVINNGISETAENKAIDGDTDVTTTIVDTQEFAPEPTAKEVVAPTLIEPIAPEEPAIVIERAPTTPAPTVETISTPAPTPAPTAITVETQEAPIHTQAPKKAQKIFIIYDNGTFTELERQ